VLTLQAWGVRAKHGEHITWILPAGGGGKWGRIVNGVIEAYNSAIDKGRFSTATPNTAGDSKPPIAASKSSASNMSVSSELASRANAVVEAEDEDYDDDNTPMSYTSHYSTRSTSGNRKTQQKHSRQDIAAAAGTYIILCTNI